MSSQSPTADLARSVTKSVAIHCPPAAAFDFLSDPLNWPRWAIVNVLSVEPGETAEWFRMTTAHGAGEIRIRADRELLLLDHDFRDPQAAWTVPARVVPNGDGCEFLITFLQPPALDDAEFDRQAVLVDRELARLRQILETRPPAAG